MEHYLDDIISVFSGSSSSDDLQRAAHDYVRLTTILGIPRKDSKNECGTTVPVFGIEIDMLAFVARLPPDKLQRAIDSTSHATSSALNQTQRHALSRRFPFILLSSRPPTMYSTKAVMLNVAILQTRLRSISIN
jgi:hypothetical protein